MKLYLLFFIQFVAHTIFDVVVDDKVELLFGKTVMNGNSFVLFSQSYIWKLLNNCALY